jgi:hypothetical protein
VGLTFSIWVDYFFLVDQRRFRTMSIDRQKATKVGLVGLMILFDTWSRLDKRKKYIRGGHRQNWALQKGKNTFLYTLSKQSWRGDAEPWSTHPTHELEIVGSLLQQLILTWFSGRTRVLSIIFKQLFMQYQGCQIFLGATYQNWGKYTKKTAKYSKWLQNIPLLIKYTKIFHFKAVQNI